VVLTNRELYQSLKLYFVYRNAFRKEILHVVKPQILALNNELLNLYKKEPFDAVKVKKCYDEIRDVIISSEYFLKEGRMSEFPLEVAQELAAAITKAQEETGPTRYIGTAIGVKEITEFNQNDRKNILINLIISTWVSTIDSDLHEKLKMTVRTMRQTTNIILRNNPTITGDTLRSIKEKFVLFDETFDMCLKFGLDPLIKSLNKIK